MNPVDCRRHCDCHHPSECIFNQVAEPERASFALVWIVGAVAVAIVAAVILVLVL
jgi:hypothetical protein